MSPVLAYLVGEWVQATLANTTLKKSYTNGAKSCSTRSWGKCDRSSKRIPRSSSPWERSRESITGPKSLRPIDLLKICSRAARGNWLKALKEWLPRGLTFWRSWSKPGRNIWKSKDGLLLWIPNRAWMMGPSPSILTRGTTWRRIFQLPQWI